MKRIIYLLCSLFILFQACDNNDVELETRTKEEAGNNTGDNPEVKKSREYLQAATDGWKISYQPGSGDTYTFFLDFEEEDLVMTDSDFPEKSSYAIYDFSVDEEGDVILAFKGGGHFQYLDDDIRETELVVKESSESQITCIGRIHGKPMNLVKATGTEKVNNQNKKQLLIALQDQNLIKGIIYRNNVFSARYEIDYRKDQIKFTYLKDRLVTHISKPSVTEGNVISWEAIEVNGLKITGFDYNNETKVVGVITDGNASGMLLYDNSTVMDIFVSEFKYQHLFGANQGWGDARDDIWEETRWSDLTNMELNFQWGERSLVAALTGSKWGWMFFHATPNRAEVSTFTNGDIVYWRDSGIYPNSTEEAFIEPIQQALKNLFATYFHEDGLYVIKEDISKYGNYNVNFYLLSTTGTGWFKVLQKSGD